jgi:hypothetical protein
VAIIVCYHHSPSQIATRQSHSAIAIRYLSFIICYFANRQSTGIVIVISHQPSAISHRHCHRHLLLFAKEWPASTFISEALPFGVLVGSTPKIAEKLRTQHIMKLKV